MLAAMTALLVIAALNARRTHGGAESRLADLGGARRIFLFSGRELVDATPEAREFLSGVGPGEDDLERLERFLALSIPDFQKSRELLPDGPLTIAESEGCCVSTQMTGGSLRIEIGSRDRDVTIDPLTHAALLAELSQARALLAAVRGRRERRNARRHVVGRRARHRCRRRLPSPSCRRPCRRCPRRPRRPGRRRPCRQHNRPRGRVSAVRFRSTDRGPPSPSEGRPRV